MALHVLLLAGLPPLVDRAPAPPVPVLDVVLVKAEPPAVRRATAEPAKPLKAKPPVHAAPEPKAKPAPPPRASRLVAPTPEPAPSAAPAAVAPIMPSMHESTDPQVARSAPPVLEAPPRPPAPATVTPPRFDAAYLHNVPPRYPLVARRRGEEGTVTLRVHVRRDGVPESVGLERSSGSSALDHAAIEAVRGWRFAPARHGAEAIDAWVLVPIVFRLEGAS